MQQINPPPLSDEDLKKQQAIDTAKILALPSIFSNRVIVLSGNMITKLAFGEASGPYDTEFKNVMVMVPGDAIALADTIYQSYGLQPPRHPRGLKAN